MLCATFFMMPKVASLVMANGALAALSATLGSQKEISWLRLSFENLRERADTLCAGRRPMADRAGVFRNGRADRSGARGPPLRPVGVRGFDRRLLRGARERKRASDHDGGRPPFTRKSSPPSIIRRRPARRWPSRSPASIRNTRAGDFCHQVSRPGWASRSDGEVELGFGFDLLGPERRQRNPEKADAARDREKRISAKSRRKASTARRIAWLCAIALWVGRLPAFQIVVPRS
jgi:hypothetical protein